MIFPFGSEDGIEFGSAGVAPGVGGVLAANIAFGPDDLNSERPANAARGRPAAATQDGRAPQPQDSELTFRFSFARHGLI